MTPELSGDIERAVQQQHGFLKVQGREATYIIMSLGTFRETMGVGTDEELQSSLKAIEQGLADVAAGRTLPAEDFFREFNERHGIQR